MSKIAVIIVTFNGAKWIEKCIVSIFASTIDCQIFVVDNDSTDQTLAILKQFKNIQIIENQMNVGFGVANNIAIKQAIAQEYEHFFLLNQDTWIENNTIAFLTKAARNHMDFGVISPMHLSSSGKELDKNFEKYLEKGIKTTSGLVEVPFVNAAAWMVSKKCFLKIGLFEPAFSHYGEDRNFCNRANYHLFKIGVLQKTSIVHDRNIVRSYQKDLIQSQFLILNSLININDNFPKRNVIGLKHVFGLPKYFFKFYGIKKIFFFTINLFIFYSKNLLNFFEINKIVETSKAGKNGL